ncbi:MAG TPA: DNA-binding protein [Verrucomicrobiales bacterium]|nr:DNA-binding protein [Verrucomicrobiales bacterium]HRJ07433.1 ORF6N domain-containing protein [Prosthecobacter sp.]HRK12688.1 ORF6N domain-containing protein [Prosthecobacter sp.]
MTSADHAIALQAERRILLIRAQKVMLDFDLAELYDVETRALKQAVRRNPERFPEDFLFELTDEEVEEMVSQNVIPGRGKLGGATPYAFTEQGVAMLSSVLRSDRAVQVNIAIVRAFVRLRQMLSTNAELARKLEAMEKKYDGQFKVVFDALRQLMAPPPAGSKKEIGFHTFAHSKGGKPKSRAKR